MNECLTILQYYYNGYTSADLLLVWETTKMEMEWRWIYYIIELDVINRFYWILFEI